MLRLCVRVATVAAAAVALSGCVPPGGSNDLLSSPATLEAHTATGVVLDSLPPPVQPLDVAVYNFPDLTGQNKENENFAEFSRALTQGGADILVDVLTKAGHGEWFNVDERTALKPLLEERQIIQNTRNAVYGKQAQSLPPLRFAGVLLEGGIIGYDTDRQTGGLGASYLGIGGNTQYRQDIVTVSLRAISVKTGRVLASITTTKTVYSTLLQGSIFKFVAVDKLLQVEGGYTRNEPVTLAVREATQLAVYSLIFEGVKDHLWAFKDPAAGAVFMRELDARRKAAEFTIPPTAGTPTPTRVAAAVPDPVQKQGPETTARVAAIRPNGANLPSVAAAHVTPLSNCMRDESGGFRVCSTSPAIQSKNSGAILTSYNEANASGQSAIAAVRKATVR